MAHTKGDERHGAHLATPAPHTGISGRHREVTRSLSCGPISHPDWLKKLFRNWCDRGGSYGENCSFPPFNWPSRTQETSIFRPENRLKSGDIIYR
jgi:hypothetical protein